MLPIVGLSLSRFAGIREARVDGPLGALAKLPGVSCRWGSGNVAIPPDSPPGVLVLHRLFVEPPLWRGLQALLVKGWVITSDMDDDPSVWPGFAANGHLAYRGVHAVTVSTAPLARLLLQYNPNVFVLPNAVDGLLAAPETVPKTPGLLRIFFGALNRQADWRPVIDSVNRGLQVLASSGVATEVVVVHDREFYDAISTSVERTFHPTLDHGRYLQVLSQCDVALLPLSDTPFNRLKSDLKFIECCAAGVVPICAEVVYGQPEHRDIGVFPGMDQWGQAIVGLCNTQEIAKRRIAGMSYVARQRLQVQQAHKRLALYQSLLKDRENLELQRLGRLESKQ